MNIPIQIPLYGFMLVMAYMFAYMSITSVKKFDKIMNILFLIFWCFSMGFITYANMLQDVIKH
jgi:hypothetical protein